MLLSTSFFMPGMHARPRLLTTLSKTLKLLPTVAVAWASQPTTTNPRNVASVAGTTENRVHSYCVPEFTTVSGVPETVVNTVSHRHAIAQELSLR